MQEVRAPAPAQQPPIVLTEYAKATLRAETRRQQRLQQKQEVQDMAKTALHHAQRRHAQQRHAVRMQRPAHASHSQEDIAMTPSTPGLAAAKPLSIRQLINNDYSRRPVLSRLGPSNPVTCDAGPLCNHSLLSS